MLHDVLQAIGAGVDIAAWSGWEPSFASSDPPELARTYSAASATLAKDPSNLQARFTRGIVCQGKRWHAQAANDFLEVVRLDPRNARAWLLLSEALQNLGEYDRARETRQVAQRLDLSVS